jgi:hypothetical protein
MSQLKITIGQKGEVVLEMENGPAMATCSLEVQALLKRLQQSGLGLEVQREEPKTPRATAGLTPNAAPKVGL